MCFILFSIYLGAASVSRAFSSSFSCCLSLALALLLSVYVQNVPPLSLVPLSMPLMLPHADAAVNSEGGQHRSAAHAGLANERPQQSFFTQYVVYSWVCPCRVSF
jgi:hypothetical protein